MSPTPASHHRYYYHNHDLFGGRKPWNAGDWTAQDDRLRGGKSHSYLTITPLPPHSSLSPTLPPSSVPGTLATFYGLLDTKTLNGAGFASQRTIFEDKTWDLSSYHGLEIEILTPPAIPPAPPGPPAPPILPPPQEPRIYTIVLKDKLTKGAPDAGKEVSWEWNFKPNTKEDEEKESSHFPTPLVPAAGPVKETTLKYGFKTQTFHASWKDFKPFYRGREIPGDEKPGDLDTQRVRRFSIMCRSFFDKQQEGPFSIGIVAIRAVKRKEEKEEEGEGGRKGRYWDEYDPGVDGETVGEKLEGKEEGQARDANKKNWGLMSSVWSCLGWNV